MHRYFSEGTPVAYLNTLKPRQNGHDFAKDILLNKNI